MAFLALAVVKVWALVDAIMRPAAAYLAADKQTKTAWMWILGLALAAHLVFALPYGLLSLIGTVAAFVYLVDVKPALSAVTRRR
ncbi:DUF2516 family protein [Nocardioides marmoriginsengisoli]|uniref:DUF2516 family protein n=2 Tax=Nocardioides marmoriginsengisoli TaxID=661483 RepID=A0A3N0CTK0_9ACTN|nr:DUF2516 family protein [Nocardioides marmoriginsengisoli]